MPSEDSSSRAEAPLSAERLRSLAAIYREGLFGDTLPFWIGHCVDREFGGFMTAVDRDGTIIDTDKGVWQQGRFTWLLGELYNTVERRPEWLELARLGVSFIDAACLDPSDGRMWFQVTRDGRPLRKRRYAFSESFAAIAYGEIALATGSDEYQEKARRAFWRFVEHNLHPEAALPKYTGVRPTRTLAFPLVTIATAQELRDSIELEEANEWIDRSIEIVRQFHMNHELEAVLERVGTEGQLQDHFDGRMLNPGHAIECAWFIMHEGKRRSDAALVQTGCTMLDWMWKRGWDDVFGGILYYTDVHGLPVQEYWHDMKFWWPQNETIIATLLAYQLTGDPKYARWHAQIHDWTYGHFPDPEYGEWFGYLHRDGRLSVPLKGNLWKGPFHIPRMQLVAGGIATELATNA